MFRSTKPRTAPLVSVHTTSPGSEFQRERIRPTKKRNVPIWDNAIVSLENAYAFEASKVMPVSEIHAITGAPETASASVWLKPHPCRARCPFCQIPFTADWMNQKRGTRTRSTVACVTRAGPLDWGMARPRKPSTSVRTAAVVTVRLVTIL